MSHRVPTGLLLGSSLFLAACGNASNEEIERQSSPIVSGSNIVTSYNDSDWASETATMVTNFGGTSRKVVAFNSEDQTNCSYFGDTRTCCPGESLLGWAYADTAVGSTFTRMRVPADPNGPFPFIWSDPAVAEVDGTGFAYISSLAVPASVIGTGCHTGSFSGFIKGACIARSTDGGAHFFLNSSQDCIQSPTNHDYDGNALIAMGPNAAVYAAFNDLTALKIDLWRARNPTAVFTRLSVDPFPGNSMYGHARMVTDGGGNLFVLARDTSGRLLLSCIVGATLCTIGTWPMVVATDAIGNGAEIAVGNTQVRTGAQYDMAMNNQNLMFGQYVDILYTTTGVGVDGHTTLNEVGCRVFGGQSCSLKSTVDPGVSVWNPAVGVADIQQGGVETVRYQAAWSQVVWPRVEIFSGVLQGPATPGVGTVTGRSETGATIPCPWTTSGYWGDYNNHLGKVQPTSAFTPLFWYSFSDSTGIVGEDECNVQTAVSASTVEVTTTWINF
jgi:hypothetical protein